MTSGIPFSKKEIDYVKAHSPKEFPSIIARGLAYQFREYNGGYRSKAAVAALMRKIWAGTLESDKADPVVTLEEPPKVPDMRKGKQGKKKPPVPAVSE